MSRVLVTGALGNVGREVARECAKRGLSVRVGGRSEAELTAKFPELEPTRFDFLDRAGKSKLQDNPIMPRTAPPFCLPAVAHVGGAPRHDQKTKLDLDFKVSVEIEEIN